MPCGIMWGAFGGLNNNENSTLRDAYANRPAKITLQNPSTAARGWRELPECVAVSRMRE
jgi:hypothetical protein